MESVFKPREVEEKWYKVWLHRALFHANVNSEKRTFSMVIPPPNITGSLHMGHALNNTIQDILNRFKRMQGFEVCWFPGTDHAGIATQVVVERELRKEGKSRFDLGRAAFVESVWKWRNQYGGIIDEQLKKLGVSCDWGRYSFTMDEIRSRAVREAFVRLYKKGVIYRGRYIVNWCPKCQTALSDLEVEHREDEAPTMLYHIRYPLLNDPSGGITVATVRPETMLGDVAVAVHPNDTRYKNLVGKKAILPLVGRHLPIIADEWANPAVGTGAVKITPAHDPNDFEVGQRRKLKPIMVIDRLGKMNLAEIRVEEDIAQKDKDFLKKYEGLNRFECREAIVKELQEQGFLVKEEPWPSNPGRCARSGDIIEPYLSVQWFARMKELAEPAIRVVREEKVRFYPERFSKLYFDWMENIRDWCISRQLWWGHRIPAWYCQHCQEKQEKPIVARENPSQCPACGKSNLIQDPDVLDTWFSSGLWPLSVMGWPEKTAELERFYPTSVLSTGRDIIFLWVARMMMLGLEFTKKFPFQDIYIHPTILDREGKRMSKSKGTGVDPLDLIAKYGADATRFGMILMSQGQDVRFNEEKIEAARNFANKIWNAARFVLITIPENFSKTNKAVQFNSSLTFYDHWILAKASSLIHKVTAKLDEYDFPTAASLLYDFIWDDFCDWYLELSKMRLMAENQEAKDSTSSILLWVLSTSLKLLHPFMPFLTEEIWENVYPESHLLWEEAWPKALEDKFTREDFVMEALTEVVRNVRNLRAEIGLKPKEKISLVIQTENKELFEKMKLELVFLTQAKSLTILGEQEPVPHKALSSHIAHGSVYLPLEGLVDIGAELRRLLADHDKNLRDLENARKLLADPAFSSKAKPEVLEKTQEKERLIREKLERLKERIASLS